MDSFNFQRNKNSLSTAIRFFKIILRKSLDDGYLVRIFFLSYPLFIFHCFYFTHTKFFHVYFSCFTIFVKFSM
ncbi:uncharacterized protein DS421_13g435930 [Arachis hypogaea]|nr:uncharacterized protein DS421_13g435930 [Arachis hypogaea]